MNFDEFKDYGFGFSNEKIREDKSTKTKCKDMGELIRDWNGNYWCKQLCGG